MGLVQLTQNEPQYDRLLPRWQGRVMALHDCQRGREDHCPACSEDAEQCRNRPLIRQISHNLGFYRVERMRDLRHGHVEGVHCEVEVLCEGTLVEYGLR